MEKLIENKLPTVKNLVDVLNLKILYAGNLEAEIKTQNLYRIEYELNNFFYNIEELNNSIHIIGRKELDFLETQDIEKRTDILNKYLKFEFPALVLTWESVINNEIIEIAKKYNKSILFSTVRATEFSRNAHCYFQSKFGKTKIIENCTLLDIYGVGILLKGYKDAMLGVTIELLERGHRFITDECLEIKNISNKYILGTNTFDKISGDTHFYLIGKGGNKDIDVTSHFGLKSTRKSKKIAMVVELEKWDDKKYYDRLGLDDVYEDFLGVNLPKVFIPVRKGRNLAIIVETAAINYKLKRNGIHSAKYFWDELNKAIKKNKENQNTVGNKDMNIPVRSIKDKYDLKVLNGESLLDSKFIFSTEIHRPALELIGYFDMYNRDDSYKGIQLFTETEFTYLENMSTADIEKNLDMYFTKNFPVIIISTEKEIPEYFLKKVLEKNVILLQAKFEKSSNLVATYGIFLENYFAPTISLHGVFMELYGFGVLLTGKSGVGKSETALELIHRKHRLIADDFVRFEKNMTGDITGQASKIPYFMEIRGLGIIDIKALYGIGAVRINKKLDMVIEIKEQNNENYLTAMDYQETTETILDLNIPKINLYISSGRNAAAMVEIAVMNLMAKRMEYSSEESYLKALKNKNLIKKKVK